MYAVFFLALFLYPRTRFRICPCPRQSALVGGLRTAMRKDLRIRFATDVSEFWKA